jgi:peptidoglycan/LPS O-acetylase OafA/YrhL
MTSWETIATRLEQTGGRSSGFDYLRIGLSVSVISWHTIIVSYGVDAEAHFWTGPLRPLLYFILPSFFALSGFLVAGSLFRNRIPAFLTLRALRIFPALFCEVLISALIIGPALTAFSLHDYFSDPKFYSYFFNVIGRIHYHLPGLFLDNPFPDNVNLQLWTIPYELECYIAITALAIFGIARSPRLFALAFVLLMVWLSAAAWMSSSPSSVDGGPSGRVCLLSFLGGVLLYVWRDRAPYSGFLAALVGVFLWTTLSFRATEYLAALPIAYTTIWLGLQDPKKLFFIAGADYSYGMYLYGFPMQQSVAHLLPQYRIWYVNLILSLIASGIAAYISWNFVESIIMKRKKSIIALVDPQRVRAWLFRPHRDWHDWYASTPVWVDGLGLAEGVYIKRRWDGTRWQYRWNEEDQLDD